MKYVCSKCGASETKLWRQYQTGLWCIKLFCHTCALVDQKKPPDWVCDMNSDSIGWLVPAVPSILPLLENHEIHKDASFWGYTSVPEDGVVWWKKLPSPWDKTREAL